MFGVGVVAIVNIYWVFNLFRSVEKEIRNEVGMNLDKDRILKEKEEELKKMTEMVAKMQAQMMQAQLGDQMKTTCN